jgi:hypothetical protein
MCPWLARFLPPGVYCYDAAVTVTGSTLTLVGSATDTWIFRIGTLGTGALTGTNFNVVMTGGATCNNDVLWWTAQAATLTDSNFIGSILAGADITVTRGQLSGQLLAGWHGHDLGADGRSDAHRHRSRLLHHDAAAPASGTAAPSGVRDR